MKKCLLLLSLCLLFSGCSTTQKSTELSVFAASSLTEAMDEIISAYQAEHPDVTVIATYDSSGTLQAQIEAGAVCDLFLSAAPRQMDALESQNLLLENTRCDLLENEVVLAVPEGNPAGIETFDQLAQLLKAGEVVLAMGNSDVPVGQYTQKIFAYYGIDESAVSSKLTYGSNVKEVTTQIAEGLVDCGIIYSTDAFSAGLAVVDSAAAEMCGQVLYPAAVLQSSSQTEEALAFLAYLNGPSSSAIFGAAGFSPIS